MSSVVRFDPLSCPLLNLGNRYQSSYVKTSNIFSRLVIGLVIKDVARIYDIATHAIIGLGKLLICATKAGYSIPATLWGSAPNYQIGKESFVHLGLSGFYFLDVFISLRNITNDYPPKLKENVENFFSGYLSNIQVTPKHFTEKNPQEECTKQPFSYNSFQDKLNQTQEQEIPDVRELKKQNTIKEKANYAKKYNQEYETCLQKGMSKAKAKRAARICAQWSIKGLTNKEIEGFNKRNNKRILNKRSHKNSLLKKKTSYLQNQIHRLFINKFVM